MKKSKFTKGRGKNPPPISKKTARKTSYIRTGNPNIDDIATIGTFSIIESGNSIIDSSDDYSSGSSSSSSDSFSSGGGDFGGGGSSGDW